MSSISLLDKRVVSVRKQADTQTEQPDSQLESVGGENSLGLYVKNGKSINHKGLERSSGDYLRGFFTFTFCY